jgi:hypothetical protein
MNECTMITSINNLYPENKIAMSNPSSLMFCAERITRDNRQEAQKKHLISDFKSLYLFFVLTIEFQIL